MPRQWKRPHFFRASIVFALACLALGPRAHAQSISQRTEIEAYRDSLGSVTDSFSLITARKILISHASHELRDSAMVHIRLGFLSMRLGDLSGRAHFEDAASEFQWVVDLQPKWPYGWFGLGLAELGVGDAEFAILRGLQSALGKDALTRSANNFAKSAEVDPSFVRGLVELSNTALRQRVNVRMDVALAALRRAARTPAGKNPEVMLVRARVEREIGSPDSAVAAADALVALNTRSPVALLEQARTRFRLGMHSGVAPWYSGLRQADPATVALYRTDLQFILPDSTLAQFDAASDEGREKLMRSFWNFRERDELRKTGDRLMEHYRRMEVARHNYRLASTHRRYDIIERYRPSVAEFDDRGVIYIRQGEPDQRASLDQPGVPFNESWMYHRAGEPDLLFHFVAREGLIDFRLVESVLDIVGYSNTVRLANSGDIQGTDGPILLTGPGQITADSALRLRQRASDSRLSNLTEQILRSRIALSPVYQRMLSSGKAGASGMWNEERTLGKRSIRLGTTTDSWERRYSSPLTSSVQVLSTNRDSIHPMIEIAWAVPVSAMSPGTNGARVLASIQPIDQNGGMLLDTVVASALRVTIGGKDYLSGVISIPATSGRSTVRVGLELNRAGIVSKRDTINIADPASPALGLTDIALGNMSVPVWWLGEHNDSIQVNPVAEFRASELMTMAYEIDGLVPDSTYRVETLIKKAGTQSAFRAIARIFGGGRDPYKVTTSQRATATRVPVRQEIALHNLAPGRYVLEVTVSRRPDAKVTRTQEITVVR